MKGSDLGKIARRLQTLSRHRREPPVLSITVDQSDVLTVTCDRCSWRFATRFGPLAQRVAYVHRTQAHPRHAA